jgi:hypothetical protein
MHPLGLMLKSLSPDNDFSGLLAAGGHEIEFLQAARFGLDARSG